MKTINNLQKERIDTIKQSFLIKKKKEYKVAKSNDFIFDKKNLKIIKKGQMHLL
jgi:hypothetical protein